MPGDGADDKAPFFAGVNRLKNIFAARDQIIGQQKIFMKTKTLGIDVIDLVGVLAVDDEHQVRQCKRRALVIRPRNGIKIFLGLYCRQGTVLRIGLGRHCAFWFARRRRLARHLRADRREGK